MRDCSDCGATMGVDVFETTHTCSPDVMFDRGAAAAFGLMGMAEAIKARECREDADGYCAGCGRFHA